MSLWKYALEIIDECGMLSSKPIDFPVEENHKLALATGPFLDDPGCYQHLIRPLIYCTSTHPELSYVVHVL